MFCVLSDTGCSLLNARKSLQNCSWKAIFHVWNSIFSGVLGRVRYQKNWKYTLGSLSLTLLVNYDLYIPLYCMHKYNIYIYRDTYVYIHIGIRLALPVRNMTVRNQRPFSKKDTRNGAPLFFGGETQDFKPVKTLRMA